MAYLLDTNILLRLLDNNSSDDATVFAAVDMLKEQSETLYFAPQNAAEFWNVVTRPIDKNGLGPSTDRADALLTEIERLFELILDTPAIYPIWRSLVQTAKVAGVQVHDARLVAWMQVHDVTHVLTLNVSDFKRFEEVAGIVVVSPHDLVSR